ncbi:glycosyltransferase family 4 protein [Nitrospira sp. Kam-Ns4a]
MKVCHVITRLDRGGAAQNTLLTVLGHDRTRYEPLVVAGRPGRWSDQGGDAAAEENYRRLKQAGIRWQVVPSLTRAIHPVKDLQTLWRLTALFRQERPAIVHTHTSKAGVVGRLAAWLAGVPVVVHTPHGHVFYGHFGRAASQAFLVIERLLARRTTWLIALTEAERDEHLARKVGCPDRFAVIPSGIELDRFRRATAAPRRPPRGVALPPEAIVVGSVGWLTPVKGHRVLIEAAARLHRAHDRLHLLLVGSGALRGELERLVERLGLRDRVHFLGHRDDVPACLAAMDLFVLPSLNEGMGRALVEAMAAGRPVIASRVGGVPAIVEDGRTGRLVPPGDPAALAAALDDLLRHPDRARALGEAAARAIGERFGAAAMARAVEQVYEEALKEALC